MPARQKRRLTDNNKSLNVKARKTEPSDRETQTSKRIVTVRKDSVKQTIDTIDVTYTQAQTDLLADETTSQESHHVTQKNTTEKKHDVSVAARETEDGERTNIVNLSKIKVDRQEPVCVKSQDDESDCSVTGIDVLDDGRLVIADGSNRNIKLFDQNRRPLSTYVWPRSTVVGHRPDGVAASSSKEIFVIFRKYVEVLELKDNQFCDKGTAFYHENWIRCITAFQGYVFILTQLLGGRKFVHRIDSRGRSLWAVPVEDFADFNVSGHGYYLTSFALEDKVNVLLSGSGKGKLDGESGAMLGTEHVDLAGPVSYGKGLVYFSYSHSNEIFALIPNTNEKELLINLPNAPYQLPHMGTRRRPQPLTYAINCLKYNPAHDQLLVSYGPNNPNPNYIDCLQFKCAI